MRADAAASLSSIAARACRTRSARKRSTRSSRPSTAAPDSGSPLRNASSKRMAARFTLRCRLKAAPRCRSHCRLDPDPSRARLESYDLVRVLSDRVDVSDIDRAHEARLGMIEDVAMPHPRTRAVELDEEPLRGIDRHVNRVLPRARADGHALLVYFLEEEAMEVNRVRPNRLIRDRPELRLTDGRTNRCLAVKRPALDRKSSQPLIFGHDEIDFDGRRTVGRHRRNIARHLRELRRCDGWQSRRLEHDEILGRSEFRTAESAIERSRDERETLAVEPRRNKDIRTLTGSEHNRVALL